MLATEPSRTAMAAAAHRAAHQILEEGRILADPLAIPILGLDAATIERQARADPRRLAIRLFIAARSRFAEETLARAFERGVRQAVILGAGLDTFAYRNPFAALAVYEVDHPATQAWKRARLAAARIAVPANLTFAPVDFEREALAGALAAAGWRREAATIFCWLGVTPYLTAQAVFATLAFIAASAEGPEVVFDYGVPARLRSPAARAAYELRAARVAALGEPWLSAFEPSYLARRLTALGFTALEDLGGAEIARRFLPGHAPPRGDTGGHLVRACVADPRSLAVGSDGPVGLQPCGARAR